MTRLAMSVMLGQLSSAAMASQSQIPLRVGDCVESTTDLEFFYKDEGEYERTHLIEKGNTGTLLNIEKDTPSTVEFIAKDTREVIVSGAVFLHQFARVPWEVGMVTDVIEAKCMTVVTNKEDYQPVIKMTACAAEPAAQWNQQFSYNRADCGPRPIRWTKDPSKCIDAVHPQKFLLTDCDGTDKQKFQMRCTPGNECHILAMGGRKDMCLWWDDAAEADLKLRRCNLEDGTRKFKPKGRRNLVAV